MTFPRALPALEPQRGGLSVPQTGPAATIAALFVETNGSYYGLTNVDPWDQERDARQYDGPWPVVAHPPCQRWGKFWAGQPLWIKRTGELAFKGGGKDNHHRIGTPPEFRDLLISIARSATQSSTGRGSDRRLSPKLPPASMASGGFSGASHA